MAHYANRLTKEDLMKGGITNITPDGEVYRNGKKLNLSKNYAGGYYAFIIYVVDEDGNKIKTPIVRKNGKPSYVYKISSVGLHRAMWAWFHGEVPEGMVVDHINNQHKVLADYTLDNLQLLTPQENLTKDRECNTRQLKCDLSLPRSYYAEKLLEYELAYEVAKGLRAPYEERHKLTSYIAHTRAKLRYYDAHQAEADILQNITREIPKVKPCNSEALDDKKDLEELRYWKKVFKEQGNKVMWRECRKVEKLWDELAPIVKQNSMKTLRDFVRR